ncbi:RNA polymerase sigma factor [Pseudonocardia sp. RS010]|uniref:RNA polymerase sigma factor n=1 Tax=Pseudonocardia sp. RS010 TaxID=3385979 RepID=UPI0039A18F9D
MNQPRAQARVAGAVPPPSDEELLGAVAAGSGAALGALYDRYGRRAWSLARRICGDQTLAEDAVQDGFLTAWRQAARFDPARGGASSWLMTLVHHRAVDLVRREDAVRRRTMNGEVVDQILPAEPGADAGALDAVVAGSVRTALDELPAEQRRALALAYFGGYTQREVASLTGVPLGTVPGSGSGSWRLPSQSSADARPSRADASTWWPRRRPMR